MTALMPDRTRPSAGELRRDLRHRRPLVLLATVAGAAAAASTLLVCLALGVAGWFLTDAGAHGTPARRALGRRAGLADGARLGRARRRARWSPLMPLGHHAGLRLGDVADRAPARRLDLRPRPGRPADRRRRAGLDGPGRGAALHRGLRRGRGRHRGAGLDRRRPRRTPRGSAVVVPAVRRARRARPSRSAPAVPRSGRPRSRPPSSPTAAACRRVLTTWLLVSLVAFLVALVTDFDTALNVTSQLHTDTGATVQLVVVSLLVVPNAVVFSGSYLLGPGFTVGTHTHRLAGRGHHRRAADVPAAGRPARHRPDAGAGRPRSSGCRRSWRRSARCGPSAAHPTYRWEEGALHGCGGGMLAGLAVRHARAAGRRRRRARAGWPTSDRSPVRSWCTRSPRSASAVCSAAWWPPGGSAAAWSRCRSRRPTAASSETAQAAWHPAALDMKTPPRPRCPRSTTTPRWTLDSRSVPIPSSEAAPARLVVLVSGSGTNLQALLDAAADPAYGASRGGGRRRP